MLHGAVERFRFATPEGFEVTEVASPLLAQWVVKEEEGRKVLEARLSEPTNETVVLNISAVRTPAVLENWTWPRAGGARRRSAVGRARPVAGRPAAGAFDRVRGAAPHRQPRAHRRLARPACWRRSRASPRIRPIVSFYAPQEKFRTLGRLRSAAGEAERHHDRPAHARREGRSSIRGSFALLPEREKLFALDFSAPADWKITQRHQLRRPERCRFELYPAADNRTRVRVPLPGVPAGQTYNVFFQATHTPAAWLDDWTTTQAAFPIFRVEGAARDVGAIAVRATDDMRVPPETLTGPHAAGRA